MKEYCRNNFWGLTASAFGTYEAVAYASGKRLPVLSNLCSRRKATKVALVAWTVGLAAHIWKYELVDN